MRKIMIICLAILIIVAGIIIYEKNKKVEKGLEILPESQEEKIPEYVDNNPVKIGLYNTEKSKRVLVKEFTEKWTVKKDIETFTTFFTQQEKISNGYLQNVFFEYYNQYENPSLYKIGYHIKFTINDNQILEKTIRNPEDTQELYDYIETYLYNGPQKKIGQWYSHVKTEEFNEETILASIKLTAGSLVKQITSDIELTAFTYDDETDFDEKGNYRGNSSYSIKIIKK